MTEATEAGGTAAALLGRPASLSDLFRTAARRFTHRPALVEPGGSWLSYACLDALSDRVAAGLARQRIGRGDRVGLAVARGRPAVAGILGILKTGACYVPVDPNYPRERIDFIAHDANLAALVTDGMHSALSIDVAALSLNELAADSAGTTFTAEVRPDDPAYVIYTSGSTGRPKGVVVTHGNVLALLRGALPLFDFGTGDRWTLFHSYNFDASVWEMWAPIATGGALVAIDADTATSTSRFARLLIEQGVTVLIHVPSVFRHVVRAWEQHGAPSSLRWVLIGGEPLDRQLIKSAAGLAPAQYCNVYGPTETTVLATIHALTGADLESTGPTCIGSAIPGYECHVVDDAGKPAADGDPGELWIGGPSVTLGYLDRDELTERQYVRRDLGYGPRRYYRTGDRVVARDDQLYYIGREDDQVKVRGFRIEPVEVERALEQETVVYRAAVALAHRPAGVVLAAAVVLENEATLNSARLRAFLSDVLPAHAVPALFRAVPDLPMTPSGKLDRSAVAAMFVAGLKPSRATG
jgi:amino acid adenylation domain-containing protein